MIKKSTVGICMTEDVLKIIDSAIKKTDFKSRSEFISEAIMWYLAKLNANDISKVLSPAVESTIRSASQKCEKNITTELYRYAIEIDIISHVIAKSNGIDDETMRKLREMCKKEVEYLSGKVSFENAYRVQKK